MRVHSMAARLCSAVVLVLVAGSLWPVHGSSHDNDATVHQVSPQDRFQFWVDYPGSPLNKRNDPQWYDLIQTNAGQGFTSGSYHVDVNWEDHKAIHLYANPAYQQSYDDVIRSANGPLAANYSGTIDSCGWPAASPENVTKAHQWSRRTSRFFDNFSDGLVPTNFVISKDEKGCCESNLTRNVYITTDTVDGVHKNVLALRAWNTDMECPGPSCRKRVLSAGMISTADHYASGRYEVVAKIPNKAEGLAWAIWTFHYEEHIPKECSDYTCYCGDGGSAGCPEDKCMPKGLYEIDACPTRPGNSALPCVNPTLCNKYWESSGAAKCGAQHAKSDPQFVGSASFTEWQTITNHEIDIEIPAGCSKTPNVCPDGSCAGDFNTANLNNYLYSNGGGEGIAYSNMCVRVTDSKTGDPFLFLGDDKYHKYRFDWHTGMGDHVNTSFVDYYIDDVYLGTNNVFTPTRGSRFNIAYWGPGAGWVGEPNNWGGGHAGDGKSYSEVAYVSSVKIEPYNQPNDIMYMSYDDQPDGCQLPYDRTNSGCHTWIEHSIPPIVGPTPPADDDDAGPPPSNDDDHAPPSGCSAPTHRPDGCACNHSQECSSDWCSGVPSKCNKHP